MKENSNGTDTNVGSMENSIEERIEEKYTRYSNGKTDTLELTIEDAIFILEKNEKNYYVEELLQETYKVILADYKRVLKENEKKNKIIDLMENYMVENGWEICFDNIYAELNNCNGMERDWCRGNELEKQDIHKYFSKKLLESEEK